MIASHLCEYMCEYIFYLLPPHPFFLEFAMSPNNNEVQIYAKKGTKWEVEHVLKGVSTSELYDVYK